MRDDDVPAEFVRTSLAGEGNRQAKYKRWADEMKRHGWDVREPTPKKVRALALQDARKRFEAAISGGDS